MPVPSLETTRQLLEAALASGVLSEVERRAVQTILATSGPGTQEVEAAFRTLSRSLESLVSDTATRRQAIDRFLDRLKQIRFVQMDSKVPIPPEPVPTGTPSPRPAVAANGAAIQWVGNLGRIVGHDNQYNRGVPEPAYFVKSAAGHEGMVLSAEVYAPGLTDNADIEACAGLFVQVVTDLGKTPGDVRPIGIDPRLQSRKSGNNLRLLWDLTSEVSSSQPNHYQYQFRFSIDGQQWVPVPQEPRHIVVAATVDEVPAEALIESSLLSKVGEISAGRIGWLGTPVVKTDANQAPQPLPAEVTFYEQRGIEERSFLELAVQVWAPGVSNRADLTAEEHSLALRQLGVSVESPFFAGKSLPLRFAGKAGIHEHDDIARFNLNQYLAELRAKGQSTPPSGDYPIEIVAGDKKIGTVLVHWVKESPSSP